ncbi:alpha/beta hydrolase family esterase [Nocardioides stalactiti]|uniref:alpha/beta hydrolase family esterase n=1 Tax=Nocardioides stalactiti TaxID=2755356 RepID=UPI0015FF29F9|nr:hypothetical protein [Nocardioides stalactiti]
MTTARRQGALGALIVLLVGVLGAGSTLPTTATAAQGPTISWDTTKRTFADGRTYFARVPTCRPADSEACVEFLGRRRAVVVFLHGAGGAEDRETADGWLGGLHAISRETIFVFAVSKDGSMRWDAGFCCTEEPVDDVRYLERVITNIDGRWPVDRDRVGMMGLSNGGMLALRVACERPDLAATVAGLAATYPGSCDTAKVRIGQWHGAQDPTVPLDGGTVTILGAERTLPSVASLAARMRGGSLYWLRVLPRQGHTMAWAQFKQATRWILANFPD